MSDANSKQFGGDHYRSDLQHWDVVEQYGIGYLEGCGSKYVARWQKKGTPLLDLNKSLHFAEKTIELASWRSPRGHVPTDVIEKFVIANDLEMAERVALLSFWQWRSPKDLLPGIEAIKGLIREYDFGQKQAQG
jgi:hypothetical protein